MKNLFAPDLTLNEWLAISFWQSLIGGTVFSISRGIWYGIFENEWLVIAASPITVLSVTLTAIFMALVSYHIFQKIRRHILKQDGSYGPNPP
jgi:hypothetical protein